LPPVPDDVGVPAGSRPALAGVLLVIVVIVAIVACSAIRCPDGPRHPQPDQAGGRSVAVRFAPLIRPRAPQTVALTCRTCPPVTTSAIVTDLEPATARRYVL
jgi:hypothetical protein